MTKWAKKRLARDKHYGGKKKIFAALHQQGRRFCITSLYIRGRTTAAIFLFSSLPISSTFLLFRVFLIPLSSFAHAEECYPLVPGRRATWRPERRKRGGRRETQKLWGDEQTVYFLQKPVSTATPVFRATLLPKHICISRISRSTIETIEKYLGLHYFQFAWVSTKFLRTQKKVHL